MAMGIGERLEAIELGFSLKIMQLEYRVKDAIELLKQANHVIQNSDPSNGVVSPDGLDEGITKAGELSAEIDEWISYVEEQPKC